MSDDQRLRLSAPKHVDAVQIDAVCASCTAPEDDPLTLAVSEYWKIVLHPDQTAPGALLIASLRHVPRVGDLTDAEAVEFFQVYRLAEDALEGALGASMVNLSCLRNWAFRPDSPEPPWRDGRPNPHVHWHVVPRYVAPLTIGGTTFVDENFGDEFKWRGRRVPSDVANDLMNRLGTHLGVIR